VHTHGRAISSRPKVTCAIFVYMTTLPVAEARAQLSKLIDEAMATHERFEITRNGRRAAVLLSSDDYDTLRDTIAVLSDKDLLTSHHEGQAAIESGDYLDVDQLADTMREAGRLPR
jgi:antitoxin YefM